MKMLLSEIATAVGGDLLGADLAVSSVSIDTRTLAKADLYIAIKGDVFDGHGFIDKAELAGACALMVSQACETELPQIVVKDTHLALAEMAGAWKSKAKVKTIAITGSNGKTTVKEMIAAILSVDAEVLFTQGNLNNDIGVPLTLLKLQERHQYAVVEMGANHSGEIAYSSRCTQQDVALITNVGAAHIEGFGSLESIARAKAEIIEGLANDGVAVLNKDDEFYDLWQTIAKDKKVVTFGLDKTADVRAKEIQFSVEKNEFITGFVLSAADDEISIKLGLAGQHNVINALAAVASCINLGIKLPQIKQGLEKMQPVTGRLQPLIGKKGRLVIDDTYNANPSSVKVALEVLMGCGGEPWFVMGALAEMGPDSIKRHEELGELIKSMNVVRLLTIGSDAESTSRAFGAGATFFSSQQQLTAYLEQQLKGNETVLIKGSRSQKMENVVAALVTDFRI
jgi:UDP-N-acetylmuramoyl-tripeptide--D-alanyl-D-alanine ligase